MKCKVGNLKMVTILTFYIYQNMDILFGGMEAVVFTVEACV